MRLLDENGDQVGIVSLSQAKTLAEDKDLDLVLLNSKVNPPVCKIMDYGKFKFDSLKKEKEIRRNQKIVELKEIQLTMTIDKHDMETKAKHANNFLKDGDKLKVVLRMKGRQRVYANQALDVIRNFYAMVEENGTIDRQPEISGKNVFMIVVPKKK